LEVDQEVTGLSVTSSSTSTIVTSDTNMSSHIPVQQQSTFEVASCSLSFSSITQNAVTTVVQVSKTRPRRN